MVIDVRMRTIIHHNAPRQTATKQSTTTEPPQLLTRLEAAKILSMSLRSLENFINARAISVVRLGKSVRVSREELRRFIESRTIAAHR